MSGTPDDSRARRDADELKKLQGRWIGVSGAAGRSMQQLCSVCACALPPLGAVPVRRRLRLYWRPECLASPAQHSRSSSGLSCFALPPHPSIHPPSPKPASPTSVAPGCHCVVFTISPLTLLLFAALCFAFAALCVASRWVSRKCFRPLFAHRNPRSIGACWRAWLTTQTSAHGPSRICLNNAFTESGARLRHVDRPTRPSIRALPSADGARRLTEPPAMLPHMLRNGLWSAAMSCRRRALPESGPCLGGHSRDCLLATLYRHRRRRQTRFLYHLSQTCGMDRFLPMAPFSTRPGRVARGCLLARIS